MQPLASEYCESLAWEQPLWTIFATQLSRQYRTGPMGREALDYAVWLPVIRTRGWDEARCLTLLQHLEDALLKPDSAEPPPLKGAPPDARIH